MESTTPFEPSKIVRPDPLLLKYYVFASLLSGPLSPIVLIPLWFRYTTLRYKFDDDGVSMSWGIFFRKEVYLTYRRLQDIHVNRNLLQRWMGLAKISLQTASGSSQAEMVIEGVREPEQLRDYLYSQMRGAKNDPASVRSGATTSLASNTEALLDEMSKLGAVAKTTASVPHDERVLRALCDIKETLHKLVAQKTLGQNADNSPTVGLAITDNSNVVTSRSKGEVT